MPISYLFPFEQRQHLPLRRATQGKQDHMEAPSSLPIDLLSRMMLHSYDRRAYNEPLLSISLGLAGGQRDAVDLPNNGQEPYSW
jgi:hypothetical protein